MTVEYRSLKLQLAVRSKFVFVEREAHRRFVLVVPILFTSRLYCCLPYFLPKRHGTVDSPALYVFGGGYLMTCSYFDVQQTKLAVNIL